MTLNTTHALRVSPVSFFHIIPLDIIHHILSFCNPDDAWIFATHVLKLHRDQLNADWISNAFMRMHHIQGPCKLLSQFFSVQRCQIKTRHSHARKVLLGSIRFGECDVHAEECVHKLIANLMHKRPRYTYACTACSRRYDIPERLASTLGTTTLEAKVLLLLMEQQSCIVTQERYNSP